MTMGKQARQLYGEEWSTERQERVPLSWGSLVEEHINLKGKRKLVASADGQWKSYRESYGYNGEKMAAASDG